MNTGEEFLDALIAEENLLEGKILWKVTLEVVRDWKPINVMMKNFYDFWI